MARLLAPLVALLLVSAGVAAVPTTGISGNASGGSTVAATGPPTTVTNSTARMAIDAPARTGQGTAGTSLSAALSEHGEALRSSHEVLSMERAFEARPEDDRSDLLISELIDIERRIEALRTTQRRTMAAYANGSVSESTLLTRFARIDGTARELDRRLDSVWDLTNRLGITYLDSRLRQAEALTGSMKGPVRSAVADRLAAGRSLPSVHVEATGDALVLAAIDGDDYVRESVFLPNLQSEGDRELTSAIGALAQTERFYPWATEHRTSNYLVGTPGSLYRVEFTHQHGRLQVSLGARTGQVFREIQRLDLPKLPTTTVRTVENDVFRVTFERTYRGGPMRVSVSAVETGDPVDATVAFGNRTVRETGADGVAWVVEPRAGYSLTVIGDGATATLNVSAAN
ncbi:MAG: hypothetical protein V5A37_08470 [Halobacteriales archaeon]